MDKRPILNTKITLKDFKEFYWLKSELLEFCRSEGLSIKGGKLDIATCIEAYLKTGKVPVLLAAKTKKKKSKFDWNTARLTAQTIITDNYKNTENVRSYFEQAIGGKFKFNVKFMNWMKASQGKTLADAVNAWNNIITNQKNNTQAKQIAPQFEYNTYIRDFLKDNPDKSREAAIAHWKIKRNTRGDNKYRRSDLGTIK